MVTLFWEWISFFFSRMRYNGNTQSFILPCIHFQLQSFCLAVIPFLAYNQCISKTWRDSWILPTPLHIVYSFSNSRLCAYKNHPVKIDFYKDMFLKISDISQGEHIMKCLVHEQPCWLIDGEEPAMWMSIGQWHHFKDPPCWLIAYNFWQYR